MHGKLFHSHIHIVIVTRREKKKETTHVDLLITKRRKEYVRVRYPKAKCKQLTFSFRHSKGNIIIIIVVDLSLVNETLISMLNKKNKK